MSLDAPPTTSPRSRSRAGGDASLAQESRSWSPGARSGGAPSAAPTRTFRLPGGKQMTLSTDRVRAAPAITPQISMMLGQNALGLGVWGLLAPHSVNRFLGIRASASTTRAMFGARELATGMVLASDPTRSSALWARVAGDVFDILVLRRLTRPDNPKRSNARLAMGVVLAITALDVVAAVRMSNVKRDCA